MRILLADAEPLLADAIKASIDTQADLHVVGTAADGVQAVEIARREQPDVVVLDSNLPNGNTLDAAREITADGTHARVLILAEHEDDDLLLEGVEAGARGFVTRSSPLPDLIDAVRRVGRGELGIPHHMVVGLVDRLVARRDARHDAAQRLSGLTRRERQVLALLADGADNDEIARALVISPETARSHVQNALRKLGVHSRLEAMAFVTRNGVLTELMGTARS